MHLEFYNLLKTRRESRCDHLNKWTCVKPSRRSVVFYVWPFMIYERWINNSWTSFCLIESLKSLCKCEFVTLKHWYIELLAFVFCGSSFFDERIKHTSWINRFLMVHGSWLTPHIQEKVPAWALSWPWGPRHEPGTMDNRVKYRLLSLDINYLAK